MPWMHLVLYGLAAIVLHEMAHILTALALGVRVYAVGIQWKGPYIRRQCGTDRRNLAITLAGPGINLWLAMMFYGVSTDFALCNLALGATNLLPIPSSDGSRALALVRGLGSLRAVWGGRGWLMR